jgi:transposase-like protein
MTSTTNLVPATEVSLIKTDALGRLHRTAEQRARILEEYTRSGMSAPKFAALCGIKYQTLASWLARLKHGRPAKRRHPASAPVRWFEASVQPTPGCAAGLLLELPGGVRARLNQPSDIPLAAALVRALDKPC